jgi:hypothetical protein
MWRAGIACALVLLGPAALVMARSKEVLGCSARVGGDADTVIPMEAGIDSEASDADAARTDGRIVVLPEVDGGDSDALRPRPL